MWLKEVSLGSPVSLVSVIIFWGAPTYQDVLVQMAICFRHLEMPIGSPCVENRHHITSVQLGVSTNDVRQHFVCLGLYLWLPPPPFHLLMRSPPGKRKEGPIL